MKQLKRFAVYAPDGARLDSLQFPSEWSYSDPFCDIPALMIKYMKGARASTLLDVPCEIAVETSLDGVTWIEPPNARFLRIQRSQSAISIDSVRDYTMPGYGWLLNKMRQMQTTGLTEDGKRMFNSTNPGVIMATLINECHARGVVPNLIYDFTTTRDSAGNNWSSTLSIGYEPGLDLFTILNNLSLQGLVDWQMQGRTLRMFNADTTMGVNRDIALVPKRDVKAMPIVGSIEEMMHSVLVLGDGGRRLTGTNLATPQYWGKWEGFVGQGGVTNPATLALFRDNALSDSEKEQVQYTVELKPTQTILEPGYNFKVGDYLNVPDETGTLQNLRVRGINYARDAQGVMKVDLIVNDRFVEKAIRNARRTNGITGGASTGGSGTSPTQPPKNAPKPAGVGTLVGEAFLVTDSQGAPKGVISLDWPDVALDTSGNAITLAGYEISARRMESVAVWEGWGTVAQSNGGRINLEPGDTFTIKVRAKGEGGTVGAWSNEITLEVPQDDVAPPPPSSPQLSTKGGTVSIRWNGLNNANLPMPSDLKKVSVWGYVTGETPAVVATFGGKSEVVLANLDPGDEFNVYMTATDVVGNESDPSTIGTITVVSLVDDPQLDAELDQLRTDLLAEATDAAVEAASGKNQITYSINPPPDPDPSTARVLGDTWFRKAGAAIIGQWTWSGSAWVSQSLSHQTISSVDLGTATVGTLSGQYITAGTLRTDRLSVGLANNLINDANFLNDAITALRSVGGWSLDAATRTMINSTGTTSRLWLNATGTDDADVTRLIPVMPGEKYTFSATVLSNLGNTFRFSARTRNETGGTVGYLDGSVVIPANVATDVRVTVTIPGNVRYISPSAYFVSAVGNVSIKNPVLMKQIPAVVIEDGAITADKIAVNAVTADKINAGAITGAKISGDAIDGKTITGAVIVGGAIWTGDRQTNPTTGSGTYLGPSGYLQILSGGQQFFAVNPVNGGVAIGAGTNTISYSTSAGLTVRGTIRLSGNMYTGTRTNYNTGSGLYIQDDGYFNSTDGSDNRIFTVDPGASTITMGASPTYLQYNASAGSLVVQGGTITGALFRTGTSGGRLQIDTNGRLRVWRTNGEQALDINPGVLVGTATFDGRLNVGAVYADPTGGGGVYTNNLDPYSGGLLTFTADTRLDFYGGLSGGVRSRFLADISGGTKRFIAEGAWAFTYSSGSSGPVDVLANGTLARFSSSRRYKVAIQDHEFADKRILTLQPKSWHDKRQSEGMADLLRREAEGETITEEEWNDYEMPRRAVGFIAEEVHDAGLREFVRYNEEGQPDTLDYRAMWITLLPIVKEHEATIASLSERLAALEAR